MASNSWAISSFVKPPESAPAGAGRGGGAPVSDALLDALLDALAGVAGGEPLKAAQGLLALMDTRRLLGRLIQRYFEATPNG